MRLDKVSYLCTVILNYSNYGTKQETIKSKPKFAEVVIGDNETKEMRESANAYEVISHTNKEKYIIFNIYL